MIAATISECQRQCAWSYCRDHGCYMNACGFFDPEKRAAYDAGLIEADKAMKPLTDALDASSRLTAEDFNTTINARD